MTMDLQTAMQTLENAGSPSTRTIYARHGVGEKQFGVSYAALEKLAKRIKVDHALAQQLWATGNHDARVLATKIADPSAATPKDLDRWAKDLDNYVIADALAAFVGRTSHARAKADGWSASKNEWIGQSGWNLVATLAMRDRELPASYFEEKLATIEKWISSAKNRVRHAMNGALIAIGLRSDALKKKAIAAARRIGHVHVDHGETGCKTPDAIAYMEKAGKRT